MRENRLFDEMSRLFSEAAGAAGGVRREVEAIVRAQFERLIKDMDVVSREEHEAVREMAIAARDDAEKLAARVDALEKRVAAMEGKKG
ncbi:accessory factor UbiK family protein [Salinarimonas sp.]|uniref:accessory factor UbiK family protein n=1 Tax=Salinarimonas sp. TaxID=2766526 RepID=UPI00391C16E5